MPSPKIFYEISEVAHTARLATDVVLGKDTSVVVRVAITQLNMTSDYLRDPVFIFEFGVVL